MSGAFGSTVADAPAVGGAAGNAGVGAGRVGVSGLAAWPGPRAGSGRAGKGTGPATGALAGAATTATGALAAGRAGAGGGTTGGATGATVTTLTIGTGAVDAGLSALRVASSSGLPGCCASWASWAAKPTWAGGGAVRATTSRSSARVDGLLAAPAAPCTLRCMGTTAARSLTGWLASCSRETGTEARATGWDCTKTVAGTATTAPGMLWLAYTTVLILVTLVVVLVTVVLLITVLLRFIRSMYSRLAWYGGLYTSRGARANQATAPTRALATLSRKLSPPTKATCAGA